MVCRDQSCVNGGGLQRDELRADDSDRLQETNSSSPLGGNERVGSDPLCLSPHLF